MRFYFFVGCFFVLFFLNCVVISYTHYVPEFLKWIYIFEFKHIDFFNKKRLYSKIEPE